MNSTSSHPPKLAEILNLKTYFPIRGGIFQKVVDYVKAVDDVSLAIPEGEIISLVGESGCGKTTLGFSLLGLVNPTSGQIFLNGKALDIGKPSSWKAYRKDFQIIFQDPYSSLNPRHTIF